MTMYESEVEFFSGLEEEARDLKGAVFNDEEFREYLLEVGIKETLYEVTSFARSVEENLRSKGFLYKDAQVTDPHWVKSARNLHATMKSRRQQLRKAVSGMYGDEAVDEIQDRVDEEAND